MPVSTFRAALAAMVAFMCVLIATPAAAQSDSPAPADEAPLATTPDNAPAADVVPGNSLDFDNFLSFDAAALADTTPAKRLRVPALPPPKPLDVSRRESADGSSTISLNKPLPTEWDAKVGAEIGLAATPRETYQPGKPLPGTTDNPGSGAAWASVDVPSVASIGARIDQSSDQSKFGTTLKRGVPLGKLSLTLQNSYSVTENYAGPSSTPGNLPLMTAPVATTPTTLTPSQVFSSQQMVKLEVLPTGTSFAAGIDTASNDTETHNKFSADQKVYGPLHVTTSVTDVGRPTSNKSITAGFKLNW
jgi:hypothetical protein